MQKTAYIVGKISGLPIAEAKENFEIKKKALKQKGYDEVYTPFDATKLFMSELDIPDTDVLEWNEYMSMSISFMMTMCMQSSVGTKTEVHALPNWKLSKGAQIEVELCEKLGIKVVYPPFNLVEKTEKASELRIK